MILIRANNTLEEITTLGANDVSLASLQKLVGGYVEIVRLDKEYNLYVNEDAKLKGLRVNTIATTIKYGEYSSVGFISGDVVYAKHSEVNL